MTKEQEKFINAVILPKLIKMAIDCTLPVDMNELCHSHFLSEAEEYNIEQDDREWIDEGKEGKPKKYNDVRKVIKLIKSLLKDDETLLRGRNVDDISEYDLLEYGHNFYSISQV